MKKSHIVLIIIIIGLVIASGIYLYKINSNPVTTKQDINTDVSANNKQTAETKGQVANKTDVASATNNKAAKTNTNTEIANQAASVNYNKPSFTTKNSQTYYKLSQVVGDVGMPSPSMTTNLNAFTNVNGTDYYKTYSYDTRSAYGNDSTRTKEGNHAHLLNTKTVSLNGQATNNAASFDFSKLTNEEKYDDVYQIASMYVEGYTANKPDLVVNDNDNYEGNLNETPDLFVDLNDTKNFNGETLYKVTADVNNYKTPFYVGLDGYVFVSSEQDFNQLFFPNRI